MKTVRSPLLAAGLCGTCLTSLLRGQDPKPAHHIAKPVIHGFIEKLFLALADHGDQQFNDQRGQKCLESRLKGRGQPTGNPPERLRYLIDVAGSSQHAAELPDRLRESDDRADEAEHGNRPDESLYQGIARLDSRFILAGLGTKNLVHIGDAAEIAEIGQGHHDPVKKNEVAGIVDGGVDASQHRIDRCG